MIELRQHLQHHALPEGGPSLGDFRARDQRFGSSAVKK